VQEKHVLDLAAINSDEVFVPILPLFELYKTMQAPKPKKSSSSTPRDKSTSTPRDKDKVPRSDSKSSSKKDSTTTPRDGSKTSRSKATTSDGSLVPVPTLVGPVLAFADLNKFLSEQTKTYEEKKANIIKAFPKSTNLITQNEALTIIIVSHGKRVAQYFFDSVEYIEAMLMKQLVAALGKILTPVDFANYMVFHNRQLFSKAFEPRPFCYAVRRPDHFPEGIISIESKSGEEQPQPVIATTRIIPQGHTMKLALNADTKVPFNGDHYVHSIVSTQFSGISGLDYSLVARARQFSSFLLMIGSIPAPDLFIPKFSIIIKNKDDLRIPLLMETLPTPKAFKDATASLSPEQKRFCKSYRSMQLSSSLFGICVVQIKPQLEKLLNLPDDSLTKEIKLTQDIENLFIEYQIPSDLLSYGGELGEPEEHKIGVVKQHVQAMRTMLDEMMGKQLQLKQEEKVITPVPKRPTATPRFNAHTIVRTSMLTRKSSDVSSECSGSCSDEEEDCEGNDGDLDDLCEPAEVVVDLGKADAPGGDEEPKPADEEPKEIGHVKVFASDKIKVDFTKLPSQLDKKYKKLDEDACLRPTIIKTDETWTLTTQRSLVSLPETKILKTPEHVKEKKRTYDLIDALTRSGALSLDSTSFHCVLAATHCFAKTLMNTVIQENVNPIEKVERSILIMATTIHGLNAEELIKTEHVARVKQFSPMLFIAPEKPEKEVKQIQL